MTNYVLQPAGVDDGNSKTDLKAVGSVRHVHPDSAVQLGLSSQYSQPLLSHAPARAAHTSVRHAYGWRKHIWQRVCGLSVPCYH